MDDFDDYQNMDEFENGGKEDKEDYQNIDDICFGSLNRLRGNFDRDDDIPTDRAPPPPVRRGGASQLQQRQSTASNASSGFYSGGSACSVPGTLPSSGVRPKSPSPWKQKTNFSTCEEDDSAFETDRGDYEEIPADKVSPYPPSSAMSPSPMGRPAPDRSPTSHAELNTLQIKHVIGKLKPGSKQPATIPSSSPPATTVDMDSSAVDEKPTPAVCFARFGLVPKKTPQVSPHAPTSPGIPTPPPAPPKIPSHSSPTTFPKSSSAPAFGVPSSSAYEMSVDQLHTNSSGNGFPSQKTANKFLPHSSTEPTCSQKPTPWKTPAPSLSPGHNSDASQKTPWNKTSPNIVRAPPPQNRNFAAIPVPPVTSSVPKFGTSNTSVPPPPTPAFPSSPGVPTPWKSSASTSHANASQPNDIIKQAPKHSVASPGFPGKCSRPTAAVQHEEHSSNVSLPSTPAWKTPPKWGASSFSTVKPPMPEPVQQTPPSGDAIEAAAVNSTPIRIGWNKNVPKAGGGSNNVRTNEVGGGHSSTQQNQNVRSKFPAANHLPTPPPSSTKPRSMEPQQSFYEEMPTGLVHVGEDANCASGRSFGMTPARSTGSSSSLSSSSSSGGGCEIKMRIQGCRLPTKQSYEDTICYEAAPPRPPARRNTFIEQTVTVQQQTSRIPCIYVDTTTATRDPLSSFQWYFGEMEREDSEKKLKSLQSKNGAFIVRRRNNDNESSPYCLCVVCQKKVYQILIRQRPDKLFAIGTEKEDEKKFSSVPELINFYSNNEIILADHNQRVKLTVSPIR